MKAHARLSPSKAKQWVACPGSVNFIESLGLVDRGSIYADEGTAAHHLAADCLETGLSPHRHLGAKIIVANGWAHWAEAYSAEPGAVVNEFEVTEDMVENVALYVDKVRELAAGAELFVEQRLDLTNVLGAEGEGGTADAIIVDLKSGHFQVHDLKYGRGRPVYAKDNPQLYLYALGAYDQLVSLIMEAPETVTVGIHQPRIGGYDEHTLSFSELISFAYDARVAAEHTRLPGADLVPGPEQCEWCPGKRQALCPALAHEVMATVTAAKASEFLDLNSETIVAPEAMSEEALASALTKADMIEEWCSAVRARSVRLLEEGRSLPGYKLVAGKRGSRQWIKDREAEIVEYLSSTVRLTQDEIYSKKLISPTQAEKLVGPVQYKRLGEFVTQSAGSPAIVPESDKRPAIKPAVAAPDEFEIVKE